MDITLALERIVPVAENTAVAYEAVGYAPHHQNASSNINIARAQLYNSNEGFGVAAGFGDNEIYSNIIIKKVG